MTSMTLDPAYTKPTKVTCGGTRITPSDLLQGVSEAKDNTKPDFGDNDLTMNMKATDSESRWLSLFIQEVNDYGLWG